jgi:hypothetical protein
MHRMWVDGTGFRWTREGEPVGAILLEQNDEWAVQRARYMTLETITALGDDNPVRLPAMAD